jgi:hypothetical protein
MESAENPARVGISAEKQCQLHPSNGYTNSSVEYLTLRGKRITELAGAGLLAR